MIIAQRSFHAQPLFIKKQRETDLVSLQIFIRPRQTVPQTVYLIPLVGEKPSRMELIISSY